MKKNHSFSTDAGLRRISAPKAGRDTWKDTAMAGLTVNVSHTGVMVWYGIVRNHEGKTERQKIGHYLAGSDEGVSLENARAIVESARHRARAGLPPWEDFKGDGENTFGKVRDRFLASYVNRNLKPNTQKAYALALNSADLKGWNPRKVTDITKKDVNLVLDHIAARGALVQANRVLAYLRKFFNWCAAKDIIKDGQLIPTDRVTPPLKKEKARTRVLSADEIKILWRATDGLNHPFKEIIRLMLLTGQRKQEVAGLKHTELDKSAGLWTQKDNKADRVHAVPLNDLALEVIDSAPQLPIKNKKLVFTTTGNTPPSGFSKAKRHLDKVITELADKPADAFIEPWQFHDIRRTVTTHLRRLGISQHVCQRILNHAEKGVTGQVYDQYDMLPEKTTALKAWGNYVDSLISGKAANVVDFKKAGTTGARTPDAPNHDLN